MQQKNDDFEITRDDLSRALMVCIVSSIYIWSFMTLGAFYINLVIGGHICSLSIYYKVLLLHTCFSSLALVAAEHTFSWLMYCNRWDKLVFPCNVPTWHYFLELFAYLSHSLYENELMVHISSHDPCLSSTTLGVINLISW